jgi:hypothetical protein
MITRRQGLKYALFGLFGLLGLATSPKKAEAKYGRCSKCSCPGFTGSGYTCSRGGCGHHYDMHW